MAHPASDGSGVRDHRGHSGERRYRAADQERNQTISRLAEAFTLGRLNNSEYQQRTATAAAATYRDELARLTDDLPGETDTHPPAMIAADPVIDWHTLLVCTTLTWACLSALSISIWLLMCILGGRVAYPGFAWITAPPASVLAVLWTYHHAVGRPRPE